MGFDGGYTVSLLLFVAVAAVVLSPPRKKLCFLLHQMQRTILNPVPHYPLELHEGSTTTDHKKNLACLQYTRRHVPQQMQGFKSARITNPCSLSRKAVTSYSVNGAVLLTRQVS